MSRDDWKWLLGTVSALLVVIFVTMFGLHLAGVVDGSSQDKGQRLAAVLTFLAAMVTASLSVIGLIVKRQSEPEHGSGQRRCRRARRSSLRGRPRLTGRPRAGRRGARQVAQAAFG